MNRRDFLKLIGIATGSVALAAAGVAPAAADELPITPQDPLARLEICGASYGAKSFGLNIVNSFAYDEPSQDATVTIFDYPQNDKTTCFRRCALVDTYRSR